MHAHRQGPHQPTSNRARVGGRQLDEALDEAILAAATRLLVEQGYSRMSIAGVAEVAGVGRPAIYRRYRDKADLVLASIENVRQKIPAPDTGDTRKDLVKHLDFARRHFVMSLAGTLLVEEAEHPELFRKFRERMVEPRLGQIAAALERGQERGEVRADLDVRVAAETLIGSFLGHYMVAGPAGRSWPQRVVDTLWPAFVATDP